MPIEGMLMIFDFNLLKRWSQYKPVENTRKKKPQNLIKSCCKPNTEKEKENEICLTYKFKQSKNLI